MNGRHWLPVDHPRRTRPHRWYWILGSAALVAVLWWSGGRDSAAKVAPSVASGTLGVVVEEIVLPGALVISSASPAPQAKNPATRPLVSFPSDTGSAAPYAADPVYSAFPTAPTSMDAPATEDVVALAAPGVASGTSTVLEARASRPLDAPAPASVPASAAADAHKNADKDVVNTRKLAPLKAVQALTQGAPGALAADADASDLAKPADVSASNTGAPDTSTAELPLAEDRHDNGHLALAVVSTHAIASGDTLSKIFDQQDLNASTLQSILEADEELLALDILRPGHTLTFRRHPSSQALQEMELFIHPGHRIVYRLLDDGGVDYAELIDPGVWQEELVAGEIHGSFYVSARKAGLSDADIAAVSKMFDAQINFAREIQAGDTFEVIRTRQRVGQVDTGQTRVEAVRIVRRSRTHGAFLHEDGNYYDLKGESLARAFLRYPVSQRYRISSNFNPRRVHPVTGRVAPHNGTDFAMPIGSPVVTTGDGVVTRVGRHPFAGRYVEIQHSGQYKTRYLHLNRVLVKRGQNVARGERIALSGNTGRSTGPHLHFELHVNGRPVNAMRADIPMASSVAKDKMPAFRKRVDTLLAMMAQPERYLAQR